MYRLFISHSWKYSHNYEGVKALLDNGGILYFNHSVPKDSPIHTNGTHRELYEAIEAKIKGCSCVIILAGVYSTYSKWINIEIEIANKYGKPIIAVEPWASERTSLVVKSNADRIVGWNSSTLCRAIREVV
ncbi:TIR domain-containing protein [Myroides odoratimimus]|uniref:TIR domain-containing protein n=1 Tax=Myroides odoratimimus TaxID=76832 RepID=UPI000917E6C0|nr:TIR domain-containing protein [Myroides odoratimimus]SHM20230.1 MTH538 TIR-like domain [Myroides odoratimimus subsp. xuanwuensis]